MQGVRSKHDTQNGVVRYLQYDTEEGVNVQIDNPLVLQEAGYDYIRFKLVDGELVYNRFGEGWDSVDEPVTQKQFLEVGTTGGMVVGEDINTLTTSAASGQSALLATSSTVVLTPGTYRIEMSASFDFSSANGYCQIVALDHATHTNLVSPQMLSSVYVYAQNVPTYMGVNSQSFLYTCAGTVTVCFRPSQLSGVDAFSFFNVIIERL